ncbi:MAG: dipeptide/oligopeptide/nickel ABC transporter permease/ATP-binding protein [Treponema sp.]|nr:dipeptide/oligopeptide/nickel ABC transporter permease/ATP-binding protein [Treponema sp.]
MKRFLIYLKSRPLGMASVIVLVVIYVVMIFAEAIAPYGAVTSFQDHTCYPPNVRFYRGKLRAQEYRLVNTVNWRYAAIRDSYTDIHFFAKGQPYRLWGIIPMERHLFTTVDGDPVFLMGADTLGRDLFSRIIHGSRISLTIGFNATAISLLLAILFGGLAGYFGGKTDWAVMRLAEFLMLIPGLYLVLFLRSLLSSKMDTGQSYMMITLILSLIGWPGAARTLRGMTHAIKREEFIMNAQLEMIPSPVIIFRQIIPQIASLIIVSIALSVPGFIMTETTLSYLGLGIADPAVSWGSLIKRDISTLANLKAYPWFLCPVWFLLGVTLAFNFLGDALRDYFDPYHTVFRKKRVSDTLIPGLRANPLAAPVPSPSLQSPVPGVSHVGLLGKIESAACLLEVKDLRVTFSILRGTEIISVEAVRGVSFSLGKGEILGIVGESGGGKSITTQAIPGLLPHNAEVTGSVIYGGKEILGLRTKELRAYRGKKIGMIFQEPYRSYDPLQNIGKVFIETFRNSDPSITRAMALNKAAVLLKEVGLPNGRERLSNFPHQFSGGQLQRIGIALALAQGCELLIADEPTTALDVTIQKQIVDLLKTLRQTRRISIIFISHDIDLVADISDRILVMYGGLIMEAGTSREIISGAAHPYTKALLAASPRFGSHYDTERLKVIPGKVVDPANPEPGCPFAPRCAELEDECHWAIPPMIDLEAARAGGRSFRCVKKDIS